MREEFHPHKTLMARYLVYSLDNCVMKLCIWLYIVRLKYKLYIAYGSICFRDRSTRDHD